MSIELDPKLREELVSSLQRYLDDELSVQLGGFDVQFLLEFFENSLACHYYNQGLADALKAFEQKASEIGELVYELEQSPGGK